ncbi:hypothetical protein HZH68_013438 [Vespula germanica]|uniref:Uncharacterized protein n=1 Tax=Vespula germanica TaxID=30212 RepID=A0A834JEP7_VESGE|nr:hypothetical protein HZH68_013438 [Vespula germanica]
MCTKFSSPGDIVVDFGSEYFETPSQRLSPRFEMANLACWLSWEYAKFQSWEPELKMDVLREREVKDSLERQLQDEQKVRGKKNDLARPDARGNTRLRQQQSISQPAQCQYMNMTDSLTE